MVNNISLKPADCGAFTFLFDKMKDLLKVVGIVFACFTIVGIPFVRYFCNRKITPLSPTVIDHVAPPTDPAFDRVKRKVENVFQKYLANAEKFIAEKGKIDWMKKQREACSKLNGDVIEVLKEEGAVGFEWGCQNQIFKDVKVDSLLQKLAQHKEKLTVETVEKILLAHGYQDHEFSTVFELLKKVPGLELPDCGSKVESPSKTLSSEARKELEGYCHAYLTKRGQMLGRSDGFIPEKDLHVIDQKLNEDVTQVLKREKIPAAFWGRGHELFQEIMNQVTLKRMQLS